MELDRSHAEEVQSQCYQTVLELHLSGSRHGMAEEHVEEMEENNRVDGKVEDEHKWREGSRL